MTEPRDQQEMIELLTDDTAFGTNLEFRYMDDGPSAETCNSSGEFTMTSGVVNLTVAIKEFILGRRRYYKNIHGGELQEDEEESFRQLLPLWNTFLQSEQGIRDTSAIISSDIKRDINEYIRLKCAQWTAEYKKWIKIWLPRWNMFLQSLAGKTLVTRWNLCLTILGFVLFIVDLVSDFATCILFVCNAQWWQALITLTFVYGAVIIHTVAKWIIKEIHCTGSADWLRYIGSSLVNWPNVKLYGALCLLEWKLCKSPANNARLVPEWHRRRVNVAYLKFMEGLWEACPQAVLQLYLLVPDLYEDLTWTDYLRIASASVSLCTAGAALVNREKYYRIYYYTDLFTHGELVVLHMWAVPVTVTRLLSVALLLTVHPYWSLLGVALHLVLYGLYRCRTVRVARALVDVITMCMHTLQFFISPFYIAGSITYRRVYHVVHFLGNTAATVTWALGTPLVCAHVALYTVIICFNVAMFSLGLLGWLLHEKYWPDSYFRY